MLVTSMYVQDATKFFILFVELVVYLGCWDQLPMVQNVFSPLCDKHGI